MAEAPQRASVSPLAVALAYRPDAAAPRAVVKGRGLVAEEVIRRARAAGVFAHQSPELVALLAQVDLDERISPATYALLAEVLAWIHRAGEAARSSLPLR